MTSVSFLSVDATGLSPSSFPTDCCSASLRVGGFIRVYGVCFFIICSLSLLLLVNRERLQQKSRLGTASTKSTRGQKAVLLARNLILNSDAAANYKYMFGLH